MLGAFNFLADTGGSFWMPPQASSYAAESDWLFWFIMWISVFFFVLVAALVVIFAWKYRYREGVAQPEAPRHSTALELTWTFIPTVIVVIIFVYGFKGYLHMSIPPPNTYNIVVYGRMWNWNFQYPNGHLDTELHVPKGVPVQFILHSDDVIHGFYIPAFRIKKDVVPGRYNRIWAQGDELGTYDIFCTQYCGDQHSQMRSTCTVSTQKDFNDWLAAATAKDTANPIDHGKKLYGMYCISCHSIDGSIKTGPSWKNAFGNPVAFQDGSSQVVDEDYLRLMITQPNSKLIIGFQPVMPKIALKDKSHDVDDLIFYIKTLSDKYVAPPASEPATAPTTAPAQ